MRIGIFGGDSPGQTVDQAVASAKAVAEAGFDSWWLPQVFGFDALTLLAVAGREVPGLRLGTGVVPTFPRHPMMLAQQALTVQSAVGGDRLVLGIGLSHQMVVENMWGLSFAKPVRHMREYLSVLGPLLHEGNVSFEGEDLRVSGAVDIPGSAAPTVVVAALGTQMLEVAGRLADGTATWMTGPATVEQHTVPTIRSAAKEAGKPEPQVVVCLPVCVTDDEAAARERAGNLFSIYGSLPSYRAMLDREGADGPADVALVGTADQVRAGVSRIADIGATDFVGVEFAEPGSPDAAATREVLADLT